MAEKKSLPKGISLRADGRYQARYTFNGKRYTVYGRTVKEVQKKLRDAQYEIEHGIYAKPEKLTVDDWRNIWTKEYRENVARETTLSSERVCYQHIKAGIGNMKLQSVRSEHVQKILNKMSSEGYSAGYMDRTRTVMNMIFNQAYMNGMIMVNPVSRTVLPKGVKKAGPRKRALTEQEQKAFLEHIEAARPFYAPIYYVGFSTGMRIGEITALEWDNIDFNKMEIHVEGTLVKVTGKAYRKSAPKTSSSRRTIPLLPEIAKRLKKHRAEQAKRRMVMGDKWEPVQGLEHLVFTMAFGTPVPTQTAERLIDEAVRNINAAEKQLAEKENRKPALMESFCPHAMRHTFATRALERGIPPKVVQSYLGHSTIDITMDIYTHVTAELEREEIKKIADQF